MVDTNDITGARLVTKPPTPEYQEGWDRIFGSKKTNTECPVLEEDSLQHGNNCCGSGCC